MTAEVMWIGGISLTAVLAVLGFFARRVIQRHDEEIETERQARALEVEGLHTRLSSERERRQTLHLEFKELVGRLDGLQGRVTTHVDQEEARVWPAVDALHRRMDANTQEHGALGERLARVETGLGGVEAAVGEVKRLILNGGAKA